MPGTTISQQQPPATSVRQDRTSLLPLAATSIASALVAVSLGFFIAEMATGGLQISGSGSAVASPVTWANVLGATSLGGATATAAAYLVGRFTREPRRNFLAICGLGVALYSVVPFIAAETVATAVWLDVLHLTVAVPLVGGLLRYLSDRP